MIGTEYRSPSGRVDYLDKIEGSKASAIAHGEETIIVGDMNIDLLPKWKKGLAKCIMDVSRLYQLKQLVNEPTRAKSTSRTLIDHIYTNRNYNIVTSGVLATGPSGHRLVYCFRRAHKQTTKPRYINTRRFKKLNEKEFLKHIEYVPWSCIETFTGINDEWLVWKDMFLDISDKHAPQKRLRVRGEEQGGHLMNILP